MSPLDMKPAVPFESEDGGETLYRRPDGSLISRSLHYYTPEDVEAIRTGYKCAKCGEAHETPFPKKCFACPFPMRDYQAEYFAKFFRGTVRLGSQVNVDEELEEARKVVESERRNREGTAPFQIVLPPGVNLRGE
jgi:hypothetical protein